MTNCNWLFYPQIDLLYSDERDRSSRILPIKLLLLLSDHIGFICPSSYVKSLDWETRRLIDIGKFRFYDPSEEIQIFNERENFKEEFQTALKTIDSVNSVHYSKRTVRIHQDKMIYSVFSNLEKCEHIFGKSGDWYYFTPKTAHLYMHLLSSRVARKHNYSLFTGDDETKKFIVEFSSQLKIENNFLQKRMYHILTKTVLDIFSDLSPFLQESSFDEIIYFRERYQNKIDEFIGHILSIIKERSVNIISNTQFESSDRHALRALERQIEDESKEIAKKLREQYRDLLSSVRRNSCDAAVFFSCTFLPNVMSFFAGDVALRSLLISTAGGLAYELYSAQKRKEALLSNPLGLMLTFDKYSN